MRAKHPWGDGTGCRPQLGIKLTGEPESYAREVAASLANELPAGLWKPGSQTRSL